MRSRNMLVIGCAAFNINAIRRQCGRAEGVMDELVARLVANVGVDRGAAEKPSASFSNFFIKKVRPTR